MPNVALLFKGRGKKNSTGKKNRSKRMGGVKGGREEKQHKLEEE